MDFESDGFKDAVFKYLKDNLVLDILTKSEYTGGIDSSGQLYKDCHTLTLELEGEVIASVYLS